MKLCVAVIQVLDLNTDVTSASFIKTMEERLAAVYSLAMSSSSLTETESSSQRRFKRATTQFNATVQVTRTSAASAVDVGTSTFYMVRHNYRTRSFERHHSVKTWSSYMKLSGNIAEGMLSLQI